MRNSAILVLLYVKFAAVCLILLVVGVVKFYFLGFNDDDLVNLTLDELLDIEYY
jgi:hypothetical protein